MEPPITTIKCILLNSVHSVGLYNTVIKQIHGEKEMICKILYKMFSSVKMGGSKQDAASIVLPDDQSWEYTIIGIRNAWLEDISVPDHLKMYLKRPLQSTMYYQGEELCTDGNVRMTVVLMECGTTNRIIQFRVTIWVLLNG